MSYLFGELFIFALMCVLAHASFAAGNLPGAFIFTLIAGVALGFAMAIIMNELA